MISGSMCEDEIHCARLTQMSLYLTCATHTILNIHVLLSRISANSMGAAQWTWDSREALVLRAGSSGNMT